MITKRSIFKLSLFLLPILLVGYWVFYDSLSTTLDEAINAQCEYFLDIPAYHVAVSPTGEVWAVTKDALLEFDGKTWRPHLEPYKYFNNVTTFFIKFDPEGHLWLGSDEGILIYDGENWEIHTNYEWGLPRTAVTSLTFDSAGRAWIGLSRSGGVSLQDDPGGGIAILEGNIWSLFSTRFGHPVTNDDILTVQFDPLGQLWVGTSNGTVAVLEPSSQDDYFGPIHRTDDFILPSVDESGISHYLAYTAKIYNRKSNPPIPSDSLGEVHAIEFDKKGQAYISVCC